MWAGLGLSVWALAYFAGHGFAYGGTFPVWPSVGLGAGTVLVALNRGAGGRGEGAPTSQRALEEAA
jgi:hypothetical protein